MGLSVDLILTLCAKLTSTYTKYATFIILVQSRQKAKSVNTIKYIGFYCFVCRIMLASVRDT